MHRNELIASLTAFLLAALLFASTAIGAEPDDRWFATIIKTEGCGPCERLLSDVQNSPEIKKYRGMAHLKVLNASDPATRRWAKNLNIRVYPTTIIQPPTTGRFGDPATVALKVEGYDGDPARLVRNVKMGLLRYIAKRNFDPAVSATYPYSSVCTVHIPELGHNGSGTLIGVSDDKALVLTCAHLTHTQDWRDRIIWPSNAKVKSLTATLKWPVTKDESAGTILAIHHSQDLALIVCDVPPNTEPAKFRVAEPGERFINIGFPAYGRSFPHWQWAEYKNQTHYWLWYTARPFPGMSGGATFAMDGSLVGVVVAYGDDDGLSVAGPFIQDFIERYAN